MAAARCRSTRTLTTSVARGSAPTVPSSPVSTARGRSSTKLAHTDTTSGRGSRSRGGSPPTGGRRSSPSRRARLHDRAAGDAVRDRRRQIGFEPRRSGASVVQDARCVRRRRLTLSRRPDPDHRRGHERGWPGLARSYLPRARLRVEVLRRSVRHRLYTVLDPSPTIDVVGGVFHRLVVVAPTTVGAGRAVRRPREGGGRVGQSVRALRRHDRAGDGGRERRRSAADVAFRSGEVAVARLPGLRLRAAAMETRIAASHGDHRAESNLVRALVPGDPKTFWGDLHGQTRATVGTGTIEEYFAFGRDVALLDMMCHQANDFQVTEEEWQRLRREIDRFHEDGRCVIFVGYEWSGMTPGGGDRNVMYRDDVASLHRSSHAEVDDMADAATDCFPVRSCLPIRRTRRRPAYPHIGGGDADIVGFTHRARARLRIYPTGPLRGAEERAPQGYRVARRQPDGQSAGRAPARPASLAVRRAAHVRLASAHARGRLEAPPASLLPADRGPAHPLDCRQRLPMGSEGRTTARSRACPRRWGGARRARRRLPRSR